MKSLTIVTALVALLSLALGGCSPTGWATKDIPTGAGLSAGQLVTVIQKDGSSLTGQYAGLMTMPVSDYFQIYNVNAARPGVLLPTIGQKIEFATSIDERKAWEGQFLGFDHKSLWVKPKGSADAEEIYVSSLSSVRGSGDKVFLRMELRKLFVNGDIPMMSAVVVKNGEESRQIPVHLIKELVTNGVGAGRSSAPITLDGNSFRSMLLQ